MKLSDMLFANAMMGEGGGGGGGDSDFSTTMIQFFCSSGWYSIPSVTVNNYGLFVALAEVSHESSHVIELPLYKGKAVLEYGGLAHVDWEQEPILTGNATLGEYGIEITGDCEITIAGLTD